jgi:virulence-associated protein VapD
MMDRNWKKASISDLEFSDYPLSKSFDELRCVMTRLGFRRTPGHVFRVWFVRFTLNSTSCFKDAVTGKGVFRLPKENIALV